MGGNEYKINQIINKLIEIEALIEKGKALDETLKQLGISEYVYYHWQKLYGGVYKRIKESEKENIRLRKLLAESGLDSAIYLDMELLTFE
jgi:putative transposase